MRPLPEAAGVDDQIANRPFLIVEEEVYGFADVAIGGRDMKAL